MKLYRITTGSFNLSGKPDLNTLKSILDLHLDELSLVRIKFSLLKHTGDMARSLNSNDIESLRIKGHSILYRENDDNIHWLIDLDHKDYLSLQRDFKLDILIS
jgi:hypothetical protein